MEKKILRRALPVVAAALMATPAFADENLFGYVRGAEVLPQGQLEFYQWFTQRADKGEGSYRALDTKTELEYGVTDRFQVSVELNGLGIHTSGLIIDGYLPKDESYPWKFQGAEVAGKYNFLSPAKDDFGLSGYSSLEYGVLDVHSGQKKTEYEFDAGLQAQKYFLEGQLVWVGNFDIRAAYEKRKAVDTTVEWTTDPEMEINLKFGTGVSYRFAPGWFAGVEAQRESEFETEVGLERWSTFAGPSVHWAGERWWTTFTYFQQIAGGGEKYEGQSDESLHLIEKTKREVRLKVGYNF